ncbi:hypothetical protein H9L17_14485 [Thermomonas brevis]|uniref:DUF1700 domain-containing protein n=1 Tax=Thermomonas brevis TaxID=215691 RepID=A0A7G9QSN1_9GAMM|nr:hypothetical protein [Thermomonas brevis]QNN46356.1 hypothetical protein H9L17_14485 [Thermomonas brevis]
MTTRHPIHAYMRALSSQLGPLDKAEADEVVREIESHIHDVVEQAEARGEHLDVAALLEGFGPPEALAAQYVAHIRTGAPPPAGFRVIQRVRQTVTHGLYYSMGAFGYSIAAALLLLALAKLWQPSLVGAWSANGGNSVAVAWSGAPYPEAKELLGYWLVPIALLASAWCAELTRRVLRVLRRGLS